jgi:hypothetical protein
VCALDQLCKIQDVEDRCPFEAEAKDDFCKPSHKTTHKTTSPSTSSPASQPGQEKAAEVLKIEISFNHGKTG